MTDEDQLLHLRISEIKDACPGVKAFALVSADGIALPSYQPGAHLTIDTPAGPKSYSLTGDGLLPASYTVAIRRQGAGSAWMHERQVGDTLTVSRPRSGFGPVLTARRHLLVSAGIGVTPMLSHLRAARRWGHPVRVVYGHASGRAPLADEMHRLGGADLVEPVGHVDIAATILRELADQPLGTHVYACGPGAMLDKLQQAAEELGWPEERVHIEHFQAAELDPGDPFTVRVHSTGQDIPVPSGVSLLEALEHAGLKVPNMCRQGVCGECRTGLLSGTVAHRDLLLTKAERAANDCLYPCVSRGTANTRIEVDL